MLQTLHERIKGWVAGIVITLIGVTFVLWGIQSYLGGGGDTSTVATVDGSAITRGELQQAYERLRQEEAQALGERFIFTQEVSKRLKAQALDALIKQRALEQHALAAGFYVGEKQFEAALLGIPNFQENGQFSDQRFHQTLRGAGYTPATFAQQLKQNIVLAQVRSGLVESAFTLPNELTRFAELVYQTRDVAYAMIPYSAFEDRITVTPKEQRAYYDQHQDAFLIPERVSVEYITLSLAALMKQMQISNDEVSDYYASHKAAYQQPTQWKVAHILVSIPKGASDKTIASAKQKADGIVARLQKQASFAALAKQYSDDVITAEQGGVMPWVSDATLEPAFANAVAHLKQINTVSAPVRTDYGFEIIKLLQVKPAVQIPLAQVKADIIKRIKQERAQKQFAEASETLANLTFSNPMSLKAAADALNLMIKTSPLFSRLGSSSGIASKPVVIAAAFSDDVLNGGNNSDVLQLDTNSVAVIRIKDHQKATPKTFKAVALEIQRQLKHKASREKANALGQRWLAALAQGKSITAEMKKQGVAWQSSQRITRYARTMEPSIVNAAFALSLSAKKPVQTSGIALDKAYALIRVEGVKPGSLTKVKSQEKKVLRLVLTGEQDYQSYMTGVMLQSNIKRQ